MKKTLLPCLVFLFLFGEGGKDLKSSSKKNYVTSASFKPSPFLKTGLVIGITIEWKIIASLMRGTVNTVSKSLVLISIEDGKAKEIPYFVILKATLKVDTNGDGKEDRVIICDFSGQKVGDTVNANDGTVINVLAVCPFGAVFNLEPQHLF